MESRSFITHAQALIARINTRGPEDRETIQREINGLLQGLQNPTLPSAARLVHHALAAGYTVKPDIQHRLQQAESCWS